MKLLVLSSKRSEAFVAGPNRARLIGEPYVGSCDADSFEMSVISQRSKVIESKISDFACLPVMPQEILELAQELRIVWKRLNEVPLSCGYRRCSPFETPSLKSTVRSSSQLTAVDKLSRDRQAIIRNAIKLAPKFYAVSRAQYDLLMALSRYRSHPSDFAVVDNGRGYSLTLVQSRQRALPPSKEESSQGITTSERNVFFLKAVQQRP